MADKDEGEAKGSSSKWTLIGFLITGLYAFFIIVFLVIEVGGGKLVKFDDPLSLNTLGDALAGIFAPLAFLWLFIATMLQSQELAEQRKELRLTRLQQERSHEVQAIQADEARHQVEYIGTQTHLLQEQEKRASARFFEEQFLAEANLLLEWGKTHLAGASELLSDDKLVERLPPLLGEQNAPVVLALKSLSMHAITVSEILQRYNLEYQRLRIRYMSRPDVGKLKERLLRIANLEPLVPDALASFIRDIGFDAYVEALHQIEMHIPKQ